MAAARHSCKECGQPLRDESRYCPRCGKAVKGRHVGQLVVLTICVLTAIALGLLFFVRQSLEPAAQEAGDHPVHLIFVPGQGRRSAPEYPQAAVQVGQQGTVIVSVTVGEDGRVETANVSKSSHSPVLDQAAVRAVRKWRFSAGTARSINVPIQFRLKTKDGADEYKSTGTGVGEDD